MKPLFLLAAELERYFQERRWRYCFIGGIANQRWGQLRTTVDVEGILIRQEGLLDWDYILSELKPLVNLKETPDILSRLQQLRQELS
jgi:hypothetical protein